MRVLFRIVSEEAQRHPYGSAARRNCIASLENIASALSRRHTPRP